MKALKWTCGALLLLMACTGNKNASTQEESVGDSAAVDEVVIDTLVFEEVRQVDSLIADVKIMDYSSDDESSYEMGKSHNYYRVQKLKAVSGKPEVMAFINQWLTLNAAGKYVDDPVTAETVEQEYEKLKKEEGVTDVASALKQACKAYLGDEAPIDEMAWESGNELDSEMSVVWNTENLLTLRLAGYDYSAGAAHGMPWDYCKTFDLQNLRVLTMDDILVKKGRKELLKLVVAALQDEYSDASGMMNAASDIDFPADAPSLLPEGVVFNYGAYEIGAYALGMPEVIIPYDKAKPYLTPEVKELLGME